MFSDVAEQMLKMMGHSGMIPSAIAAKDVAAALTRLKAAVELSDNQKTVEIGVGANIEDESKVSIVNRAFPLIKMLTRAAEEGCDVIWRKQ
tara:strand:- start:443 stop:715 length:273 start_codon:yes stop_codon:yes gene_type:complete